MIFPDVHWCSSHRMAGACVDPLDSHKPQQVGGETRKRRETRENTKTKKDENCKENRKQANTENARTCKHKSAERACKTGTRENVEIKKGLKRAFVLLPPKEGKGCPV